MTSSSPDVRTARTRTGRSALPESEPETESRHGRVIITHTEIEILGPMVFGFGSAKIGEDLRRSLVSVARTIAGNPSLRVIEIVGYSDVEEAYPSALAIERAEGVVEYLIGLGIDRTRLRASGRGPSEPIAFADGDPKRQYNRRIEFLVAERQ